MGNAHRVTPSIRAKADILPSGRCEDWLQEEERGRAAGLLWATTASRACL